MTASTRLLRMPRCASCAATMRCRAARVSGAGMLTGRALLAHPSGELYLDTRHRGAGSFAGAVPQPPPGDPERPGRARADLCPGASVARDDQQADGIRDVAYAATYDGSPVAVR